MAEQVTDPVEGQDNPEDERPEWLPDNFKSPEDLARSYTESQRKITEQAQQLRGLEDSIGALTAQQEQFFTQQNQPDPQSVYAQWQEAFDNDPIGTQMAISRQIAQEVARETTAELLKTQDGRYASADQYAADRGFQFMEATYPDWHEYKDKVSEIIRTDPLFNNDAIWVNPDLTSRALDNAYQIVRAKEVLEGNTVVQQQLSDTRTMKLAAQTASGAGGRLPAEDDQQKRWEEIANASSGKLGL